MFDRGILATLPHVGSSIAAQADSSSTTLQIPSVEGSEPLLY
jgi:hypothetical protein